MSVSLLEASATLQSPTLPELPTTGNGITMGPAIEMIRAQGSVYLRETLSGDTAPFQSENLHNDTEQVAGTSTAAYEPRVQPSWKDFIDFPPQQTPSATPRHAAPEQTATATSAAEQVHPSRLRRALRHVTNTAMRLVTFGQSTNGTEAVTYETSSRAEYTGSHRAATSEHRHRSRGAHRSETARTQTTTIGGAAGSVAAESTFNWASVVTPSEATIVVAPAHRETALQPEKAQTTVVQAPATRPRHAAPSNELVHVPSAASSESSSASAAMGDPEAVFLQGLRDAGYDSVKAFEEASYFATPEEKLAMNRVLAGIRRSAARWHRAGQMEGDTTAGEKFRILSGLTSDLSTRLGLRGYRSPEEAAREAAAAATQPMESNSILAEMLQARHDLRNAANFN